jgi:hypothetical protein
MVTPREPTRLRMMTSEIAGGGAEAMMAMGQGKPERQA